MSLSLEPIAYTPFPNTEKTSQDEKLTSNDITLPTTLMQKIISDYLTAQDYYEYSKTNSKLFEDKTNDPQIWKKYYLRDFGEDLARTIKNGEWQKGYEATLKAIESNIESLPKNVFPQKREGISKCRLELPIDSETYISNLTNDELLKIFQKISGYGWLPLLKEIINNKIEILGNPSYIILTALYLAAKHGHKDTVDMFIQRNLLEKLDETTFRLTVIVAFLAAIQHGQKDVVDLLIQGNLLEKLDETTFKRVVEKVFITASSYGQKNAVDLFIQKLLKKLDETNLKETVQRAFITASANGQKDVVDLLIQSKILEKLAETSQSIL